MASNKKAIFNDIGVNYTHCFSTKDETGVYKYFLFYTEIVAMERISDFTNEIHVWENKNID